jgi:uncharacterized membrane protein YqhA
MALPALSLYVVSLGLIILGMIEVGSTIVTWVGGGVDTKEVLLGFTEVIDTFLLASVAYVIGLGLLYLFVDQRVPLPTWLRLTDLDDLKERLISVVVAALSVGFLGSSIREGASIELLYAGAAAALVIVALGVFLRFTPGDGE